MYGHIKSDRVRNDDTFVKVHVASIKREGIRNAPMMVRSYMT